MCALPCVSRATGQIGHKFLISKDIATPLGNRRIQASDTGNTNDILAQNPSAGETFHRALDISDAQRAYAGVRGGIEDCGFQIANVNLTAVIIIECRERIQQFLLRRQVDKEVGELSKILGQ